MNIFIYCQSAAMGKGGMEKVATELANYWSDSNHNVYFSFLTNEKKKEPQYRINQKVIQFPFQSVKNNIQYKESVLAVNPDIIILFGVGSHIIRLIGLFYKSKIPIILHEGSNPERIVTDNWAKKRNLSRAEALWERELIISLTNRFRLTVDTYRNSLSSSIRYKAKGFPNAFKVNKENNIKKKKRIINIGGLKENKNLIPLIMAFSQITKEFPEWEIVVFSTYNKGNKDYLAKVENLITELALDNIHLCGETSEIDHEYGLSSIHVITSLSEGLSGCVAESMCHGIPTIGYKNVPGVDGLVKDGINGLLADPNEPILSLVDALRKLMSSYRLREQLGAQAYKDSFIFDPQTNYGFWDDILHEAIEDHKKNDNKNEIEVHYRRMADAFFKHYFKNEYKEISNIDL